jgi:hypothetical protein
MNVPNYILMLALPGTLASACRPLQAFEMLGAASEAYNKILVHYGEEVFSSFPQ